MTVSQLSLNDSGGIDIKSGGISDMSKTTRIYMQSNPAPDYTATVSISKFEAALNTYPFNGAHYEILHAGGDIFKFDCIGYKSYLIDHSQTN